MIKNIPLFVKVGIVGFVLVMIGAISGQSSPQASIRETNDDRPSQTTKEVSESIPVGYQSVNEDNPTIPKGQTAVKVVGVLGEKKITYKVVYADGVEIDRIKIGEEITKEPVNEVIYVGTYVEPKIQSFTAKPESAAVPQRGSCDPNYTGGCVPVVSYDLNCSDISFSVRVVGRDIHRFDRDGDGIGCESNG